MGSTDTVSSGNLAGHNLVTILFFIACSKLKGRKNTSQVSRKSKQLVASIHFVTEFGPYNQQSLSVSKIWIFYCVTMGAQMYTIHAAVLESNSRVVSLIASLDRKLRVRFL